MPSPGFPAEYTPLEYLTKLSEEGLIKKYNGNPPQRVIDRMNYELGIIETTGFAQYILIVRDFAQFAAKKGIYYGVRGSAGVASSPTSWISRTSIPSSTASPSNGS